jgi:hypothetical protein
MHHVLRGVRDGVSSEQNLKNNGLFIPLKPENKIGTACLTMEKSGA